MADTSALLPDPLFVDEPDLADDPSQKDGFRVVYDKECPFEMRLQENDESPQEVGTLEAIRCRVCVQGDVSSPSNVVRLLRERRAAAGPPPLLAAKIGGAVELLRPSPPHSSPLPSHLPFPVSRAPPSPAAQRLELSSETDLFFHYSHSLDERTFRSVREEQRLMIEFQDYANVLARSLNLAIKEPHSHLAVFIMNRDGNARLDFIQNLEYKFVELLSVSFLQSAEAVIREHISFRYRAVREKLTLTQARLNEVTNIVSARARALLLFSAALTAARERASPPNPPTPSSL